MTGEAVRAVNISKSFKDVKALNKLDFSIRRSELFGFIGPDGAGKTTLFRTLATLLLPDTGTASLMGFDVVKDFKKIRKIIGYMPGRFSLYLDLSVEENLAFYARVFGTTIETNYHLIKDVYGPLEPFKKRLAGKLSGGMKQKLALSCALIHKPKVLFLDEPTTGVDAVSRKEFWNLLSELKKQDITIIVSTPYMDEASRCDRVAFMQEGNLLKVASPQEIIDSFDDDILEIRAGNLYELQKKLRVIEEVKSVHRFGDSLHVYSEGGMISSERLESILAGEEIISHRKVRPGMEDCFLSLLEKHSAANEE